MSGLIKVESLRLHFLNLFSIINFSAKIDVVVLDSEVIESGRYYVEESDSFVVKH